MTILASTTVLAACAANTEPSVPTPATTSTPATTISEMTPPDLVVTSDDSELLMTPFTYCWSEAGQGICVDGTPPDPLPALSLGSGDHLGFHFPLDWHLQGSLLPGEGQCEVMEVDILSDGTPVENLGPAGTYRMEIFGQGQDGDGAWSFQLATDTDRPRPGLFAHTSWYPGEGDLDPGAPFTAVVGNLVTPPEVVTAEVEVLASGGSAETFPLAYTPSGCSTIDLEAPAGFTSDVIDIGDPPYEVTIDLEVDGETYTSETLRWPNDYPAYSSDSRADMIASS
jgi:hypothetical protein